MMKRGERATSPPQDCERMRSTVNLPRRFLVVIALVSAPLGLWGCVPGTTPVDERPKIAVINGPTGERFIGLATAFESEALSYGLPNFQFVSASRLRFREVRIDFTAARAARQAALLAGSFGAELAVLVGAPVMEREIEPPETSDAGTRWVESALRVRVVVVDVDSAAVVHTASSQTYVGERFEDATEPVVRVQDDPTLLELQAFAVSELVPGVLSVLTERSRGR